MFFDNFYASCSPRSIDKEYIACVAMIFDRQGFYTTFKSITKIGLPQSGYSKCIQNRNFVITVLQHIKSFLLVPQ